MCFFPRGYMIHIPSLCPKPPSTLSWSNHKSTVLSHVINNNQFPFSWYSHWVGCLVYISPVISPSTHEFRQLFFFCVTAPTFIPLHVGSFLFQKSLRIVLSLCIAATSGEGHYVQLYHSVSVSVYNVLLVLLLSLCINSSSHGISPVHYSFEHNSIPSLTDTTSCLAIPQLKDIPWLSNFLTPQRVWL